MSVNFYAEQWITKEGYDVNCVCRPQMKGKDEFNQSRFKLMLVNGRFYLRCEHCAQMHRLDEAVNAANVAWSNS